MNLPWFPFYIKDFLANTKRLNTEAKGAYLCLMLDYYEQGAPPPDDDEVLAAICELPIEAWKRHRKVIAPLFEIKDGHWCHDRIEKEMLEAQLKHSSSIARAKAGGAARWAGKQPKPAKPPKKATVVPLDASSTAQALPQALPEQSPSNAHTHIHIQEKEDSLSTAPLTPLSADFRLTEDEISKCLADEASADELASEFDKFTLHHREAGGLSADWHATWGRWWWRWKEHRAKLAAKPKAPPRVEVNRKLKTLTPASWKPNERHAALCEQLSYDLHEMEERFRDAGKAKGYVYIDHDAAFRNFIKNQQNFTRGSSNGARQNAPAGRGSIVHAADVAIAHLEREVAADNQMRARAVVGLPDE